MLIRQVCGFDYRVSNNAVETQQNENHDYGHLLVDLREWTEDEVD